MKKNIFILIIIVLIGLGFYFISKTPSKKVEVGDGSKTATTTATSTPEQNVVKDDTKTVIGKSVQGRDITAYHFGKGEKEILFVGGIHGGYEWNTVLVAYRLMDYLSEERTTSVIPENIKITVIPVLNPDGLTQTVGKDGRFDLSEVPSSKEKLVAGRFNANEVDLNRNFDCDWKAEGVWQSTPVSGGTSAFSEPESLAVKNYVEKSKPGAVVVWYSAAGGVFSSNCHNDVSSETRAITNVYAKASGYPAHEEFNFYEITGDMVNWLAKINVPAISVLLTTHDSVEWDKNQKGFDALVKYYSK